MKLKAIVTTLIITVSLSVNAKWVDLICEPQLFGGYFFYPPSLSHKQYKCTANTIDKRFSSSPFEATFQDCYTWMIGFDTDSDSAEVESFVIITLAYKLKKSSSHYNMINNDSFVNTKFTIKVNRETLKYEWKKTDNFGVDSNIGQCRLSSKKNII